MTYRDLLSSLEYGTQLPAACLRRPLLDDPECDRGRPPCRVQRAPCRADWQRTPSRPLRSRAAVDAEFEESIPSAAESLARIGARARADMADVADSLGHPELREARDAGLDHAGSRADSVPSGRPALNKVLLRPLKPVQKQDGQAGRLTRHSLRVIP